MKKRNTIIYWVATVWLSLGMVSTGIVQLIPLDEEVEKMTQLGYPLYFLTIISVWKLLGAIAVLVPKLVLLKEWAYAGFGFLLSGAIFSHLAISDGLTEYFGPLLLLILTTISWYFRSNSRRTISQKNS